MRAALCSLLLGALMLIAGVGTAAAADDLDSLIAAAKQEGTVVVDGPPDDQIRQAITSGFKERYGIEVSYISAGGPKSGPRVRAERAAGRYLLDVLVTGADSAVQTFLGSGWLDPIKPVLVDPNVTDLSKWRDHKITYVDPDKKLLRLFSYIVQTIAVNSKVVKPSEIATFHDLLKSEWQGKMMVRDPTVPGAGGSLISYLYVTQGPDFVQSLYKTQKPVLVRDTRQGAQSLAQGAYGIWAAPDPKQLSQFKSLGYPIEFIFPTDGPPIVTGGYGIIALMNKAPHPNAAKLFVNWIASKDGQTKYGEAAESATLRNDVEQSYLDPKTIPQPGQKVFDTYEFKYVKDERAAALDKARALVGF